MISHVSKYPDQFSPPDASGKAYFAVMYQEIEGEDVKNIVRVYFTPPSKHNVSDYGTFNYNEIVLPGSTWISTFSLEDGMLIYTRYVVLQCCTKMAFFIHPYACFLC
jgi:hypothetical protein